MDIGHVFEVCDPLLYNPTQCMTLVLLYVFWCWLFGGGRVSADRTAVEPIVILLNSCQNGTMATPVDLAAVNAKVSLTSFTLCQIKAAVPNVVPGSQIRPVSRSGMIKLKTIIERDGFAKHSFLYVVETQVASLDPLHVIVEKYHKTGFIPDGTSICADGDDG